MADVTIARENDGTSGKYTARVAGAGETGKLTWKTRGNSRVADHTIVPPSIGGQGIALELVKALVADAKAEGFKIVPQCSYVAAQFKRHPEWAELRAEPAD
ncbi:GNAT family N-acetyltransferase [Altererythrobacter aquiaggeris]|uniref:GNAT family N-acetyltransferase n=1 Tax=Aestuarierythrobacter aquiaggeris TaxID=1898396 RepID=UPI003015B167